MTSAAANGTAPSSSNNLPASARPRPDRQKHDHLLPLHGSYGPRSSLSELGDLNVQHSLTIAPEPPTPSQDQEAGRVPTRNRPHSFQRKNGHWREFILQLIRLGFSWFQMGLPAVYFHRVASIIQKSEITMAELALIQRRGASQAMLGLTTLASGRGSKIDKIPAVQRFKKNWEAFATRCREEWSNLNIISTLLLR